MNRLVVVIFTALCCTGCQGCQSQRQPVDPFLGRTTVPPPATGVIGPSGSITPDSGGFLQRAPATNPATGNQFTPPESNNDLYAPPGINNGIPTGSYGGGYQSSAPSPQNTRWARANPNRTSGSPAVTNPAAMASQPPSVSMPSGDMPIGVSQPSSSSPLAAGGNPDNVQLTSGSQSWQPAQTDATAAATTMQPTSTVNQIRIVPSTTPPSAGGDPADIMNLPPKSSSPASGGATM